MSNLSKELIRQIIADGGFQTPKDIGDYLKDMFKDVIQEMLEKELALELGYEKGDSLNKHTENRRNGYSKKTVKSQFGNIDLDIPRDRDSNYNPKVIPKHTRDISGLEEKIISLYARGMSTRDIHDQIKDLYGIEISAEYVSHITDVVIEHARLWQNRPLEPVYPFVFMDAIHYWSALNFTDTLLFFHMHIKPSIYAYDSSTHSKKLYAVLPTLKTMRSPNLLVIKKEEKSKLDFPSFFITHRKLYSFANCL